MEELKNIDFNQLPLPFVIKPSVDFFSVGVPVISDLDDWNHAIKEITNNINDWINTCPEKVIDNSNYILE